MRFLAVTVLAVCLAVPAVIAGDLPPNASPCARRDLKGPQAFDGGLRPGHECGRADGFRGVEESFERNPLFDSDYLVAGDALARLTWRDDAPAFAGDAPGSLVALYDSTLPAGAFGISLGRELGPDDTYTAAAVLVIESGGFVADENGFFQVSWGLWNTSTTGLNRTGDFESFAADTFDVIEFAWFPNVSPLFGGPFLAPTIFGEAVGADPDAFGNASFLFDLEAALPLDVPLLAVLRHRAAEDALTVQVYRIGPGGSVLPVNGAVGVVALDFLTSRAYAFDAVGPLLWHDGFTGPEPAVRATLIYHRFVVTPGIVSDPAELLH